MSLAAEAPRAGKLKHWTVYFVLWCRMAFGLHAFISGLNYFVPLFALSGGPGPSPIGEFQSAMTDIGMYGLIKAIEMVVGAFLLANRLVPLMALIEMPITIAIAYLCFVVDRSPNIMFSGAREVFFNSVLLAAYADYFLPLFAWRARYSPIWDRKAGGGGGA
ncbi:MAG: hypothetical protein JNJ73_14815 [Hyphomonadaceae bacterium]|nr:hypothetical protein [Hyphomonadaceae bacterium]